MRVYGLTKLGSRIARTKTGNGEELKVLQFLKQNPTATDAELETVAADRMTMRLLKKRGLVQELTREGISR